MVSNMRLQGCGLLLNFNHLTANLTSIESDGEVIYVRDNGVRVTLNGAEISTGERAPSQIIANEREIEALYEFPKCEIKVSTFLAGDGGTFARRVTVTNKLTDTAALEKRAFLDIEVEGDEIEYIPHKMWASSLTALFARYGSQSCAVMFDHPFGMADIEGRRVRLSELTGMKLAAGTTYDDGTLYIRPTRLTGKMLSQAPVEELDYAYNNSWQPFVRQPAGKSWWSRGESSLDEAEVEAAREIVASVVPWEKGQVTSCHVPWCENDFEIDINTPEGEAAYTRMLDLLAEIGCEYTIFSPGGGDYPQRPDGGWQHVMWLGLGALVADCKWTPDTPLAPGMQKMLDLAKAKGIGVLAYVNPAYRFGFDDSPWQRMSRDGTRQDECCYACDEFREWLTRTLIEFKNAYGLAGYCIDFIGEHHPCFDPTHNHLPGEKTHLAGWRAFQSITRALNEVDPDIIIDGRLCTFRFAPFSTAGITYPHPFICDEQPNHMTAWPDLSLDRVFANFQRRVAYWGRNRYFIPNYKLPGFITHQQSRTFRWKHSWDRLGWKYNVLSSIAASGMNSVINYLPVREENEYCAFTDEDRTWLRSWLAWAKKNADLLLVAKNILGEPAPEKVDGISACLGNRGVIFLINPNYRPKHVRLTIGEELGLRGADYWLMTEMNPNPESPLGCVAHDSAVTITVPPHQVLAIGISAGTGKPEFRGRAQDWIDAQIGEWCLEDGEQVAFPYEFRQTPGWQVDEVDVRTKPTHWVKFVCDWKPDPRIKTRLESQRTPLKLEPHESIQPYLDPGRLLLSLMFRFPENIVQATMKMNGEAVPVETCYLGSSWRVVEQEYRERNICGFYADLDGRIKWDTANRIELELAHYGPCEWVGAFIENL